MSALFGVTVAPVELRIPRLGINVSIPSGTPCRKIDSRSYWVVADIMDEANHLGVRIPDEKVSVH